MIVTCRSGITFTPALLLYHNIKIAMCFTQNITTDKYVDKSRKYKTVCLSELELGHVPNMYNNIMIKYDRYIEHLFYWYTHLHVIPAQDYIAR